MIKFVMDGWNKYLNKKVYVILKNKRNYSGIVKEIEDVGNGLVFISLIDIKNKFVTFTIGEIEVIEMEE